MSMPLAYDPRRTRQADQTTTLGADLQSCFAAPEHCVDGIAPTGSEAAARGRAPTFETRNEISPANGPGSGREKSTDRTTGGRGREGRSALSQTTAIVKTCVHFRVVLQIRPARITAGCDPARSATIRGPGSATCRAAAPTSRQGSSTWLSPESNSC